MLDIFEAHEEGSKYWANLEKLDATAQTALLYNAFARATDGLTTTDIEMWEEWVGNDRANPRAGGWMDQPAGVMAKLRQLDRAHAYFKRLKEAEGKIESRLSAWQSFAQELTRFGR